VSISGEIRQQVAGALELSAEARNSVEAAAELVDSAVGNLTAVLAASNDPKAAQAIQSLILAGERLGEVAGLFGLVAGELPIFLGRLDQASDVKAERGSAVSTSHGKGGKQTTSVARPESGEDPATEEKTFMAWWGTKSREIADAGSAESAIGEAADRLFSGGVRGVAIRIGKGERERSPLRIYIDTTAGRAAVSWQGSPGVESGVDPDEPLVVEDDPKLPPVTVPPERACVTPATAIRAAREYVETGRRPTCLDWNPDRTAARPERAVEPRTDETPRPDPARPPGDERDRRH
jgi:Immunity protein Imm1